MEFVNPSSAAVPEHLTEPHQRHSPENIALYKAALAGSYLGVQSAIEKGGKPNYLHTPEEQKNSLHVAAEGGHVEIVRYLLEHGAVVDASQGTTHSTALMMAVRAASIDCVKALLEKGANVNAANAYGNTALHEAAQCGHESIIEALCKAGADVNARNHKGSTPLHFYCYGSSGEGSDTHTATGAKHLIEAGAIVSSTDNNGMTPLLVCCTTGRNDIITMLMDLGASCHVKDAAGRDAYDIAAFHKQKDVMQRFCRDSPMKRFPDNGF